MLDKFTICVLLHGDYAGLAGRCLNSICQAVFGDQAQAVKLKDHLRVGLNEVGDQTRAYLHGLNANGWLDNALLCNAGENIHKYPMMRRMFYGSAGWPEITTPYVMWFDDDSFLQPQTQQPGYDFFGRIAKIMAGGVHLLGATYTQKINDAQVAWVKSQPWYTGQPVDNPVRFIQGAWWVADMAALRKLDYPWQALDHNGGDVMLGAACKQAGLAVKNYRDGVAINADAAGRESKAERRGYTSQPIGMTFTPAARLDSTAESRTSAVQPTPSSGLDTDDAAMRPQQPGTTPSSGLDTGDEPAPGNKPRKPYLDLDL